MQALELFLHAGHKVVGKKQAARVDAESRQGQRIFLYRVALVLKQHPDHGDAQEHLRHGPEQAAGAAESFSQRILQLPHTHQHGPQGQGSGEDLEGE